MFSRTSRYANAGTYPVTVSRDRVENVTRLPVRPRPAVRGFHRRTESQRADHIAGQYLGDATAFWRLCDASDAFAPDALNARAVVAVPVKA